MNDMPTAFGNSDWCNVYSKIVGSSENDKIKEWLETEWKTDFMEVWICSI